MIEEVRLYSTVAGELVKLVQTETPKCFVEYEQYLCLEKAYKELMEKEYTKAHWEQFYDNR